MKSVNIPVITFEELERRVVEALVHSFKNYSPEETFRSIVQNGVCKLDKDHLDKSLKSLTGYMFLETCIIEGAQNGGFVWLVSGTNAMVIKIKP
jgi:FAD synthase